MKQTYTFQVNGMHCKSCAMVLEQIISEVDFVESVKVDSLKQSVSIFGDFGEKTKEKIGEEFTDMLSSKGYSLLSSSEKNLTKKRWKDFFWAVPIAGFFILLFVFFQKIGLVNFLNSDNMTYGTAFFVGVIASLSSCMAIVGGLILSLSATYAKERRGLKPQLLFHVGRIFSFFFLGGIIGLLGSAFQLNSFGSFFLSFLVGVVMLVMGVNLLDVFSWTKRFQVGMPKFISRYAFNVSRLTHAITPTFLGIVTFFLPCGFTQSMQIYALSTGNFLKGGLTMFFFALGTFPVLALLSFSSSAVISTEKREIFFKAAGLIVIIFALFNIINSFVIIGVIPSVFNF